MPWLIETRNGKTYLANQQNGDCHYLRDNQCTIYDERPLACRMFDCRTTIKDPAYPWRIRLKGTALQEQHPVGSS